MATKYYDEYGNEFVGPFGVATHMSDGVASYPDEASARGAAVQSCTRDDHTATVYGPKLGTLRARKVAMYKWAEEGPYEV